MFDQVFVLANFETAFARQKLVEKQWTSFLSQVLLRYSKIHLEIFLRNSLCSDKRLQHLNITKCRKHKKTLFYSTNSVNR